MNNDLRSYVEGLGIIAPRAIYRNLSPAKLTEIALARGEGMLSDTGALVVHTGKYTGRSPNDRFVVDSPSVHTDIDWGSTNMPISQSCFDLIYAKMTAYLQDRDVFIFDGYAGADEKYHVPIRVITELASENMFIHQLLVRPTTQQLCDFVPGFTVIAVPGFKCVPATDGVNSEAAIILNFEKRMVVIAGSQYAGEIKKAVFSVINYVLPKQNVFTMHCSANVGKEGDSALFFGLSGTGKTTLSADPERYLVGDDEHAWSDEGIFNIEGGCYAKCIGLSKETEPEIFGAIRFGALVENVVIDPRTRRLDFNDGSLTENTRVGYPVSYIPNALIPGVAGHPKTILFLTADAFGVIPPISRLTREQAMFHFVSGYTSKLAGTERGIKEPVATFSTCFGAPFLPLDPASYASMLGERIDKHEVRVFLVNTGWCGHKAGNGKRMKLAYTRAMVSAALSGALDDVGYEADPYFGVLVPKTCPNVPDEQLVPGKMWQDQAEYEKTARELAARFRKNFEQYDNMPREIVEAGPQG
ncbi:MAG: phosphoenolpyruvate carboxykinase (ATP) [Clostridia bacterium]|nr:phosphoenolpyruvate carboxykinase (ATP) [Clostridia bacterium]